MQERAPDRPRKIEKYSWERLAKDNFYLHVGGWGEAAADRQERYVRPIHDIDVGWINVEGSLTK